MEERGAFMGAGILSGVADDEENLGPEREISFHAG